MTELVPAGHLAILGCCAAVQGRALTFLATERLSSQIKSIQSPPAWHLGHSIHRHCPLSGPRHPCGHVEHPRPLCFSGGNLFSCQPRVHSSLPCFAPAVRTLCLEHPPPPSSPKLPRKPATRLFSSTSSRKPSLMLHLDLVVPPLCSGGCLYNGTLCLVLSTFCLSSLFQWTVMLPENCGFISGPSALTEALSEMKCPQGTGCLACQKPCAKCPSRTQPFPVACGLGGQALMVDPMWP